MINTIQNRGKKMRYAITYENHEVFQHFGKTPAFLLLDVEDGQVVQHVVSTNGKGHGALAGFLKEHDVNTLICGGIGQGARDALATAGIALIAGASGDVDVVLKHLLDGTLKDDPSGMCNHHHEGHEHNCGSHSCGSEE